MNETGAPFLASTSSKHSRLFWCITSNRTNGSCGRAYLVPRASAASSACGKYSERLERGISGSFLFVAKEQPLAARRLEFHQCLQGDVRCHR